MAWQFKSVNNKNKLKNQGPTLWGSTAGEYATARQPQTEGAATERRAGEPWRGGGLCFAEKSKIVSKIF